MALKIEGSTPSVHPTPICKFASISIHAPVAQGTEHLASNQRVGGSNPSGRATTTHPTANTARLNSNNNGRSIRPSSRLSIRLPARAQARHRRRPRRSRRKHRRERTQHLAKHLDRHILGRWTLRPAHSPRRRYSDHQRHCPASLRSRGAISRNRCRNHAHLPRDQHRMERTARQPTHPSARPR